MAELRRTSSEEEFFVGYLPVPPRLKRFVLILAASVAALVLATAAVASSLRDAPAKTALERASLLGVVEARAYGLLWTSDARGALSPVLLTRGGKFGAPEALKALAGKIVRLDGLLLERDGYRLLEVSKIDANPTLTGERPSAQIPRTTLGRRTLRGEIVDIKCWVGRMKPGDGRTHRACAQFCVSGGIPPVLVTRDRAGAEQRYVLTTHDGGPINDAVLPYVAEAVEIDGELEVAGPLRLLRVDPAHIRRL